VTRRPWVDRHFGFSMFVLVAFVVGVVVVSFHAFPAQAATGPTAPYTDAQATGYLTLYDKTGAAIKSGTVTDKPFAYKAVGSKAAATPYNKTGHKATLMAFQPRQGVAAAQWSGDTLTASTGYADVQHPAAQGTTQDFALKDFLDEFPAKWDGMVELRLYLTAPGVPAQTGGYAATDIKVAGNYWVVVGGGPGAGSGGANIPGKVSPAAAAAIGGKAPASAPASAASAAPSAGSAGAAAAGGAGAGTGIDAASLSDLPYMRTPGYLFVSAAVLIAIVFGAVLVRRRNRYVAGEW
jgi:hypothetical protein